MKSIIFYSNYKLLKNRIMMNFTIPVGVSNAGSS